MSQLESKAFHSNGAIYIQDNDDGGLSIRIQATKGALKIDEASNFDYATLQISQEGLVELQHALSRFNKAIG